MNATYIFICTFFKVTFNKLRGFPCTAFNSVFKGDVRLEFAHLKAPCGPNQTLTKFHQVHSLSLNKFPRDEIYDMFFPFKQIFKNQRRKSCRFFPVPAKSNLADKIGAAV